MINVMIRIITCYSPYLQPLISAIPSPLHNYISLYLYILGYCLFLFLAFFFNLEFSSIHDILPLEPYLLVAFHLQGRDNLNQFFAISTPKPRF